MPYDVITPYGPSAIGVMSDAEKAAQQRALAFQLQAAQEGNARAARSAPAEAAAPMEAPDTYLASHNRMVDLRQQQDRLLDNDAARNSDIPAAGSRADIGDWRGLQTAKIQGGLQNENQLNAIRSKYDELLKGAAAPAAAPAAVGGTSTASAGAAPAAAPNQDAEENRLTELALLGSRLNGGNGQMPDIAGMFSKRAERSQQHDLNALKMKEMEAQIADAQYKRDQERQNIEKTKRGEPLTARSFQEVSTDPQILGRIKRLGDIISNNNYYFTEENMNEVMAAYQELARLLETVKASPEAKARVLQMAKDTMREKRQDTQGMFHGAGMGKLDGFTG